MTIQTSWEMMQQYREALSVAKWRKQVRAEHLEQIRLAGDYMRSLRYWLTVASSNLTLKARKAALAEHLAHINALQTHQAVTFCCEIKLVGDSCQSNLRAAMSWAETATSSTTFNDWQECHDKVNACIADALVQLDVVRSTFKSLWKQAKADMNTARIVIDTCAKDILHPVAVPKAVRKEAIRKAIMPHTLVPQTVATCCNSSLYKLAAYHLGRNATRELQYGFKLSYKVWSRAIVLRSIYPRM